MRKSRSPQATSATNCLIKAVEIKGVGKKKTPHRAQQVPWEVEARQGRGWEAPWASRAQGERAVHNTCH